MNIKFYVFSLAITLLNYTAFSQKSDHGVKVVVIDAGHGGKHPGTMSKTTKEKDITLQVALKVGAFIEENIPDVKVVYTRKTDVFVGLDERAKIANDNNADAFISVHVNSLPTEVSQERRNQIYGTETYVMGLHVSDANFEVAKRENSVILLEENHEEKYAGFDPNSPESYILFSLSRSAHLEASLSLASKIENQFGTRAGRRSRGVKQAGFIVLYKTAMPSVLVEIGYLSNEKEEKDLNDDKVQNYIASAIYRAFKEYKQEVESIN